MNLINNNKKATMTEIKKTITFIINNSKTDSVKIKEYNSKIMR